MEVQDEGQKIELGDPGFETRIVCRRMFKCFSEELMEGIHETRILKEGSSRDVALLMMIVLVVIYSVSLKE